MIRWADAIAVQMPVEDRFAEIIFGLVTGYLHGFTSSRVGFFSCYDLAIGFVIPN